MMTHLQMFKSMLKNQQLPVRAKCPGNTWDKVDVEIDERDKKDIAVILTNDEVGFVFNRRTGKFMYVFNWKE